MADIYLMVGTPACGKSTWAREHIDEETILVSRDEIRNQIVNLDAHPDRYFSQENTVYNAFIEQVMAGLNKGFDVIVDATNIDFKSRIKFLRRITAHGIPYDNLVAVVFSTTKEECLERNSKRKGWRRVPDRVIHEMYDKYLLGLKSITQEGFDVIMNEKGEIIYAKD